MSKNDSDRSTEQQDRYAAWLKASVHRRGTTYAELGRRVGLTRNQTRRLTTGERVWDKELLEKISDVLEVPPPDAGATA